jgi:predicted transcriptional regulator
MADFTIRIPDELKERVKNAASRDNRSLNREIEHMLDGFLAMRAMSDEMSAQLPGTRDEAMMRLGTFFAAGFPPHGTEGSQR